MQQHAAPIRHVYTYVHALLALQAGGGGSAKATALMPYSNAPPGMAYLSCKSRTGLLSKVNAVWRALPGSCCPAREESYVEMRLNTVSCAVPSAVSAPCPAPRTAHCGQALCDVWPATPLGDTHDLDG